MQRFCERTAQSGLGTEKNINGDKSERKRPEMGLEKEEGLDLQTLNEEGTMMVAIGDWMNLRYILKIEVIGQNCTLQNLENEIDHHTS